MTNPLAIELLEYAKKQKQTGKNLKEIEQLLREQTNNESLSDEVFMNFKKELYQEYFRKGMRKIGLAVVLLLFSFVYSCIHFHNNEPFELVMYTFTIAGTGLLFWGCYDIFN